jgi:hypothetical protein
MPARAGLVAHVHVDNPIRRVKLRRRLAIETIVARKNQGEKDGG